jgi:hypothetical protein
MNPFALWGMVKDSIEVDNTAARDWGRGYCASFTSILPSWHFFEIYKHMNFTHTHRICVCVYIAHGSVVDWGTMLQVGRSSVRFRRRSMDFSIDIIIPATLWPWCQPSLKQNSGTRNLPGGKGRPAREADNLTIICQPIVKKMWEPRRLMTLWAFTACYRDSFT